MRTILKVWILGVVVMAGQADARTWRIYSDGSGDAPSIQAGIDSAATGDTVLVTPGTYDENLNTAGKTLALLGETIAQEVIVDGGDLDRVLTLTAGIVKRLTLRNGLAVDVGGGVLITGPGSATLQDNIIEENIAGPKPDTGGGGGIYINNLANSVIIESNIIRNNYASIAGGGIADRGPDPFLVLNIIRNNLITENGARFGGGLEVIASVITGNVIANNWSELAAGGINMEGGTMGEISGNTLVMNHAGSVGAGIRIAAGNPTIRNNLVALNGPGGGVVYTGSNPPFCNDIWGNDVDTIGWSPIGNGNFSADPLFCDLAQGNYFLRANSPCLPESMTCGLIGAYSVGCDSVAVVSRTWGAVKGLYRIEQRE